MDLKVIVRHRDGSMVLGDVLAGVYEQKGENHDRPVFQKQNDSQTSRNVWLYFWGDLENINEAEEEQGWWFGCAVGGEHVWARHAEHTDWPPEKGWVVAGTGPDVELVVSRRLVPVPKRCLAPQSTASIPVVKLPQEVEERPRPTAKPSKKSGTSTGHTGAKPSQAPGHSQNTWSLPVKSECSSKAAARSTARCEDVSRHEFFCGFCGFSGDREEVAAHELECPLGSKNQRASLPLNEDKGSHSSSSAFAAKAVDGGNREQHPHLHSHQGLWEQGSRTKFQRKAATAGLHAARPSQHTRSRSRSHHCREGASFCGSHIDSLSAARSPTPPRQQSVSVPSTKGRHSPSKSSGHRAKCQRAGSHMKPPACAAHVETRRHLEAQPQTECADGMNIRMRSWSNDQHTVYREKQQKCSKSGNTEATRDSEIPSLMRTGCEHLFPAGTQVEIYGLLQRYKLNNTMCVSRGLASGADRVMLCSSGGTEMEMYPRNLKMISPPGALDTGAEVIIVGLSKEVSLNGKHGKIINGTGSRYTVQFADGNTGNKAVKYENVVLLRNPNGMTHSKSDNGDTLGHLQRSDVGERLQRSSRQSPSPRQTELGKTSCTELGEQHSAVSSDKGNRRQHFIDEMISANKRGLAEKPCSATSHPLYELMKDH